MGNWGISPRGPIPIEETSSAIDDSPMETYLNVTGLVNGFVTLGLIGSLMAMMAMAPLHSAISTIARRHNHADDV